VCVCVCVCVCACLCVCMCVCVRACVRACTHACMRVFDACMSANTLNGAPPKPGTHLQHQRHPAAARLAADGEGLCRCDPLLQLQLLLLLLHGRRRRAREHGHPPCLGGVHIHRARHALGHVAACEAQVHRAAAPTACAPATGHLPGLRRSAFGLILWGVTLAAGCSCHSFTAFLAA